MEPSGAAKRRKAEVDKENADTSGGGRKGKVAGAAALGENGGKPEKSVEQIYQKKTQLEHILLRPDSYVGSIEKQSVESWVFDDKSGQMIRKKLDYVPALYKIFDEILVNAADNLVRCPTQNRIDVEVNRKQGYVSVRNNGQGIPIQMHGEHKCYVPELVFGHLLTSDNYDDSEKKVVGGRNGYGAKLTNIFSTQFVLETADSSAGKKYKQVWEKNMGVCNKPVISNNKTEDFTQVTFYPDLKRFGMDKLEEDICALFRRRAYDVAASTHGRCTVYLDGKQLDIKSFEDYVGLHLKPDAFRTCKVINERWEIAIGLTDGSGFQQVSFVNSINTSRGGSHVNYVSDQVVNAVLEKVSKQKGGGGPLAVKAQHVKGYLMVFVNCLVENPAFDSQTKETLTSKRERFGSDCKLPDDVLEAVLESGLIDALQEWSKAMGKSELAQHLNRSDLGMQKRLFGVPKLEDANKAGTKEGSSCTLILTEGDSAKALAVAGLSVIGRDHYGIFPLRGKLRNVRELTVKQMLENREIDQVMRIMALDASKEYQDVKSLRYGSIMIMTDQDYDGSHIKGLIINFIQNWFPSLLRVPGFLKEFVTPIVKMSRGEETITFFTVPEYEEWKQANNDGHGWKCKYYKGLGTSTSAEAKEYFSEMAKHEIQFTYSGEKEDDLIDMAFNSKRADDRKAWISACEEGTFVDHAQPDLSYTDFIEKELVLFAKYDVVRAIPNMVDGLKPGQRKVLFGAFKKKISGEIKVAQLSGYIAENSSYHHGEVSLQGTIIAMAQTFVGANNINLFEPRGQFGSRLQGGKDHAAARYIFTRLSKVTRCLFPEEDDAVLEYLTEEGHTIEPRWYCPIVPAILVNGADGIGTGWSTSIPNYNPRDLIANIRRFLRKEPMESMTPWYRGFKGTVAPIEGTPGRFEAIGVAAKRGRVRLEITELPVKRWTQDYKDWLVDQLPQPGAEKRAAVTELREYHSENSVHFVLNMTPDKLAEAERRGFEKVFHLKSSISTSNMILFDANGKIKKYESPEDIIAEFAPVRLELYEKRKAHMLAKMARDCALLSNKLRFVELVITDKLEVEKRKAKELCTEMRKLGLQHMCQINGHGTVKPGSEEEAGAEGFKYLLSMKMWSLTDDKVEALRKLRGEKLAAMEELRATSVDTLWERDLQRLETALDACDAEDAKEAEAAAKLAAKNMGEDNILVNKQCVLVLSRNFRAKRVRTSEWKAKRRGAGLQGRTKKAGKKGTGNDGGDGEEKPQEDGEEEKEEKEEKDDEEEAEGEATGDEALAGVFCCHDFDALLVFSEHGFVYMLQALDVPLAKKMSAPGAELKDFLPELEGHRIASLCAVSQGSLKDQTDEFVVLVSKEGLAKKVSLDRYRGLRPGKGVQAMKLDAGDELRWAVKATANSALVCATAEGFVLRVSLGEDWSCSSAKGPGRCVMKTRPGSGDYIADISISDLTPQEMKVAAVKVAKKKVASEKAAEARAAAAATTEGGEVTKAAEDEDDEEMPEAEEEENEVEEAEEAEEGKAEDGQAGEDAAEQGVPTLSTTGQCVLVITESGMGLRTPLSCKRIALGKKGGKGRKVIKILEGKNPDRVVAACVTSGKGEVPQPSKPPAAWQLYVKDQEENGAVAPEAAAPVGGEEVQDVSGFAKVHERQEKFKSLPDEQQIPYLEQADELKQRYDEEMDEYRRQDIEEALLGSTNGQVSRVIVGSVPITTRVNRGKTICKTKGNARICAVSLLSSMEDDPDDADAAAAAAKSTPKPKTGAALRAALIRRRAGIAAATPLPDATPGAQSSVAPSTPPLAPSAEVQVPASASLPPLALSPRRLIGKTRTSIASSSFLERQRMSMLASPKLGTPGRTTPGRSGPSTRMRSSPGGVQMSILKPKLRLIGEKRSTTPIVRTIDVAEWFARAKKALSS